VDEAETRRLLNAAGLPPSAAARAEQRDRLEAELGGSSITRVMPANVVRARRRWVMAITAAAVLAVVVVGLVALNGRGERAAPVATEPAPVLTSTTTTTIAPTTIPPTTVVETTTSLVAPASVTQIEIPAGNLQVGPGDLIVVHSDGDLYLHPGMLTGSTTGEVRLADLGDPRQPVTEGPGPNAVDGVAGVVNGAVVYTDCCEPVAGDLLAATGAADPTFIGYGASATRSPDGARLATAGFGLAVIDVATGRTVSRDVDQHILGQTWGVEWAADGSSLLVLYFDDSGFGLWPYIANDQLTPGKPVSIGVPFEPSTSNDVRLAGRGPDGDTAVAQITPSGTVVHFYDSATLAEVPSLQRELPAGARSVRLAPDGVGMVWVVGEELWYRPADGQPRSLGVGYSSAWFG
jgi:hypothetical protein